MIFFGRVRSYCLNFKEIVCLHFITGKLSPEKRDFLEVLINNGKKRNRSQLSLRPWFLRSTQTPLKGHFALLFCSMPP